LSEPTLANPNPARFTGSATTAFRRGNAVRAERRRYRTGLVIDCLAYDTGRAEASASERVAVTAGAETDVLAMDYAAFSSVQREAVVHAHPRGEGFKECVIVRR